MKSNIKIYNILLFAIMILFTACGNSEMSENHDHEEEEENHAEEVHFSLQQFKSLQMKVDTLPLRNLSSYVEANGELEVSPKNEATVTAIIGANVSSIKVIEGDKVKKGQILAYISHPDLINLQTDYMNTLIQLQFLKKDYLRHKKLYEEKVGSGKEYQKIESEYRTVKGKVKGFEAQFHLLGLNAKKIQNGTIYEQVPVLSPIDGYIQFVEVKTGQYVEPQTEMFEIVNIERIHADLMVFEKEMHKVKNGQKVKFRVESLPNKELEAVIFSVGKAFEQKPKAIHIHAEIENRKGFLIPGMYIRGRILVDGKKSFALPKEGIVKEGEKYFIFTAEMESEDGETEWAFKPMEVIAGIEDDGWVEIKLLQPLAKDTKFAWNNTYYLLAEMKKGEAEHSH